VADRLHAIGNRARKRFFFKGSVRIVNNYLVPVNLEVPSMEVALVSKVATLVNLARGKVLGELGICRASAAVTNAIFHASGKRIRDLSIRAEIG
jgi:xanthine dehydrogenase YagR molybdenum-binding subunit